MFSRVIGGIIVFMFFSGSVGAEEKVPKDMGYVLKVKENSVIVDLTRYDGVVAGAILNVLRIEEVTHPVTGKVLKSKIPVGTLQVKVPGDEFSIAVPVGNTRTADIHEGDIVMLQERWARKVKKKYRGQAKVYKRVEIWTEVVDYGERENASDWYVRYETDFMYLQVKGYAFGVRMGIGGLNGGYTETANINYYYGFADVKLGIEYFTCAFAIQMGLNPDGFGVGVDGRVTIGSDLGTHLTVGGYIASYVGGKVLIMLSTPLTSKWRMFGETIAENLPKGGKMGVRFGVGLEHLFTPGVGLMIKAGAGGRTSEMVRPYGGLGVSINF